MPLISPFNPGDFDRRVMLEVAQYSTIAGEHTPSYRPYAVRWGNIIEKSGSEAIETGAVTEDGIVLLTIYYDKGLIEHAGKIRWREVNSNLTLDVVHINDLQGGRRFLELKSLKVR